MNFSEIYNIENDLSIAKSKNMHKRVISFMYAPGAYKATNKRYWVQLK